MEPEALQLWTKVFDLISQELLALEGIWPKFGSSSCSRSPERRAAALSSELHKVRDALRNALPRSGPRVKETGLEKPFLDVRKLDHIWGLSGVLVERQWAEYLLLTTEERQIVLASLRMWISERDFDLGCATFISCVNLDTTEWKELWESLRLPRVSVNVPPLTTSLQPGKISFVEGLWGSLLGNVRHISSLEVTYSGSFSSRTYLTKIASSLCKNPHPDLNLEELTIRNFSYSTTDLEAVCMIVERCAPSLQVIVLLACAESSDVWPSEAAWKDWSQVLKCCTDLRRMHLRLPSVTDRSEDWAMETVDALLRAFSARYSERVLAKLNLEGCPAVVKTLPYLALANISQIFFHCFNWSLAWEDLDSWSALGVALRKCCRLNAFHLYVPFPIARMKFSNMDNFVRAIGKLWLESQHSSVLNINMLISYEDSLCVRTSTVEEVSRWIMNNDNTFMKSISLAGIDDLDGSGQFVLSLMELLAVNRSIISLSISDRVASWTLDRGRGSLFEALRTNTTLRHLALWTYEGLRDEVFKSLLEVLTVNLTLESILLRPWNPSAVPTSGSLANWLSWDGEWIHVPSSVFGEDSPPLGTWGIEVIERQSAIFKKALQRNKTRSYLSILSQPTTLEAKAGRLFLCGSPLAVLNERNLNEGMNCGSEDKLNFGQKRLSLICCTGKTRLSKTMLLRRNQGQPLWLETLLTGILYRYFTEMLRRIQGQPLWLGSPTQVETRTAGIEVQLLHADDTLMITIWDLAGQWIYRTIQDLLFPRTNQPFIFVFVFSMVDARNKPRTIETLDSAFKDDLLFWLRFIASSSQVIAGHSPPQLLVVISHKDCVQNRNVDWARIIVNDLRIAFSGIVDLCEGKQLYFINSLDEKYVKPFGDYVLELFKKLLHEDTHVGPKSCLKLASIFASRPKQTRNRPVWYISDLYDFCRRQVEDFRSLNLDDDEQKKILRAVSLYLHDVGSIIMIPSSDLVIVDPSWLTHSFLGELIKQGSTFFTSDSSGVVGHGVLDSILENFQRCQLREGVEVQTEVLIELLKNLDLCYRLEDGDFVRQYFMPSLVGLAGADSSIAAPGGFGSVESHIPSGKCEPSQTRTDHEYCGFRLQCKDRKRTLLTASFFSRFQVRLRNKLKGLGDRNIICRRGTVEILVDGHHIFVESDGPVGDHIDIMIKPSTSKPRKMALVFVKENIVDELQDFCTHPEGCPGVCLTIGILRTQCVRKFTPLAHRGDTQAILVETLRKKFLEDVERKLKDARKLYNEVPWPNWILNYEHAWPAIPEVGMSSEFEFAINLLPEDDLAVVKARLEEFSNQHLQNMPSLRSREDEVRQISDELYEVYAPMSPPKVELVFIHGLQEEVCDKMSYLTAWSTRDDRNICWLNTLLPRHVKSARIISVSYDASPLKTATKGRLDMYLTAENLVSSLISIGKVGQRCPVVLVGHSLGGLVITEVCNEAHRRGSYKRDQENVYGSFLGNVKGLFYYSTPHKGSLTELFAQGSASSFMGAEKGDLMECMQVFDKNQGRRNSEFAWLKGKYGWSTHGVVESNETPVEGLPATSSRRIVDEASARANMDEFSMIRNTDHFTICRPITEMCDSFLFLVNFVNNLMGPEVRP